MIPASTLMTADELLANPVANMRSELVRGQLRVREPAGWSHGIMSARVLTAISAHLHAEQRANGWANPRGRVLAAETGFTLQRNPDTVRAPDVAYVRWDRCPQQPFTGFAEFAPDLAVEVQSPSQRAGTILAKVADWLEAGSETVWLMDPLRRTAQVYRADGSHAVLAAHESLNGDDVLPGFALPLSDMFD
jgi:Uma2 family endonuclease